MKVKPYIQYWQDETDLIEREDMLYYSNVAFKKLQNTTNFLMYRDILFVPQTPFFSGQRQKFNLHLFASELLNSFSQ